MVTSQDISKLVFGSVIKVSFIDGSPPRTGKYIDWTSDLDNEPDGESITIDSNQKHVAYELFLDEIKAIEVVGEY